MQKESSSAVHHNTSAHRFELNVDGATVFAEYKLAPGTIIFDHTLTPGALRGRGLAARVVEAGLNYARAEHLKVVPQCWYVADYIRTHPDFQDLLAPRA
jgi:predicted GNAT family acetyltransferase